MSDSDYWTRKMVSRRAALRAAVVGGGGLAALSLVGCGGDKKEATTEKPSQVLDPTTGVRGGNFVWQAQDDPGGGLQLTQIRNAGVHQMAGLILEGLLEFRNGTPAFRGTDIDAQPNLAQALPETPADGLTYIFKLRPAKFHNGRQVTSEDAKYSFDKYATDSAWKNDVPWYDKTETPDPQTVVVKTKFVYADALQSLAARYNMEVLAKEHQESPDAEKKIVGTGPFMFAEYNPPVVMRYKRNPDYHRQPYPYFDSIDRLGTSDKTKQIADFTAGHSHMTFWYWPEERDQIKKQRSDAQYWGYIPGSPQMVLRDDQAPFNDKRVRQALSMSYDRKAVIEAVANGETEPDQWLTYGGEYWGFRKPKDMGALAKYFGYDVQAAKQLLSAAGVTLPIKVSKLSTWNATVLGQKFVDHVVLMATQWRNNGILDAAVVEETFGQQVSTAGIGNYKDMYWTPNTVGTNPTTGLDLRNAFWSPPEGAKPAPTTNTSYTNIPELSAAIEKQLTQRNKEERIQTFRRIEEVLAEEMPRIPGIPYLTTWFGEPTVMNMQTPREAYNGGTPYMKYWWFKDGKAP